MHTDPRSRTLAIMVDADRYDPSDQTRHSEFSPAQTNRASAFLDAEGDRLLGAMPDIKLAARLACTAMQVLWRRRKLEATAFRKSR